MKMRLVHSVFYVIFLLILCFSTSTANKCLPRQYKSGIVCVCNSTFCDTLEFDAPKTNGEVLIMSTSEYGLRFEQTMTNLGNERLKIKEKTIFGSGSSFGPFLNLSATVSIDESQKFQEIIGFGNSFTGAVSYHLKTIPDITDHIFKSYFSNTTGLGFNFLRIPIGGSDFDFAPWAYNESPVNDVKLSNFTKLDQRDIDRLEQLKDLMKVSDNPDIKFVGAAWSSPKWMKTNNDWTGLGVLKDEYYQTWADYHVKYLKLMKEQGVNYWAISTGNEPLNGIALFLIVPFMSLGWLPRAQGKWVAENLGPTLRNSSVADVKILAGDDQRYTFPWWFSRMYSSYPESRKYVDGHAVHWYWDKYTPSSLLEKSFRRFPEKLIIASEASSGQEPWVERKPVLGYWPRCEDYVIDIIEDLNNYVNAWIDWNLILDEQGGPNYANNFLDSPMVVNSTSKNEIYKQPIFYGLGHFSRFITPGSVRIGVTNSNIYLKITAALRPDGLIAVVLYNSANQDANIDIKTSSRGTLKLNVPSKSIHSILIKL